jgi:hypothetical protein
MEFILLPLVAVVYSVILTEPGMLLADVHYWCEQHLPSWLFMPLIGCYRCVTGQMALWYYMMKYWTTYDPITHLAAITVAIYLSVVYNYIYERIQ